MAVWQMDIVGGMFLANRTEAKIVNGVDDRSRYCVIASVLARATGRAVCPASPRRCAGSGSRRKNDCPRRSSGSQVGSHSRPTPGHAGPI